MSSHGVPGGIASSIGVKTRHHPVKHANALHLGQLQQLRFKDFNCKRGLTTLLMV